MLVPLSPAQESMWLEQLLHPESINGGFFSVLIRGGVTAAQVRAACAAVCEDNPQLRGLVTAGAGETARIAVHRAEAVLRFEELELAAGDGEELAAARGWYRAHRLQPWDLTGRAPIAFSLLVHGEGRCTLVVGVHHIAFDGRSKFVFARQFLAALGELCEQGGLKPRIPYDIPEHPSIDQELEEVVGHWLAADLPGLPGLVLPRREGGPPAGGRSVEPTARFDLPGSTCARLAGLAKAAGVSFFTGLVAGAALRLYEYGNSRFVLGIPVDTSLPGTREQIGLQVNVVPCLIEVPPGATFNELLAVSGRAVGLVQRYRRVPFSWVLRHLRKRHGVDVSQGAFDGVGISYPTVVTGLGEVRGLDFDWDFFAPNSTQSFDLTLQLRREGDGAYGRLDHSTLILDAAAAGRFAAGYARLLAAATAEPDRPLAELLSAGPAVRVPVDGGPGERGGFPGLTTGGGRCPVEQFLPTPAVTEYVRAGGVVELELRDAALGWLGCCGWGAEGLVLTRGLAGRSYRVTTAEGRPLPYGVPGLLGLADDPRPSSYRAWIDADGRVRVLGTAEQLHDWVGRRLDRAEAEARVAALAGVREAAVVLASEGGALRAVVVVAPVAGLEGQDGRVWRRAVRRVWPSGWPQPGEVRLVERLPRLASGEVDVAKLA
ncbi:condensation domain-containing protein [Kitasatospora sp. McL0602]|uniref:condensation domain-containing protein n=1 Tax=Kitasatospora sp. McL0602 TaxID=3439530 RepID=UPI003F8C9365